MSKPLFLTTGATGATGRAAIASRLHAGPRVRALDDREDDASAALRALSVEVKIGDFADPRAHRVPLIAVSDRPLEMAKGLR